MTRSVTKSRVARLNLFKTSKTPKKKKSSGVRDLSPQMIFFGVAAVWSREHENLASLVMQRSGGAGLAIFRVVLHVQKK